MDLRSSGPPRPGWFGPEATDTSRSGDRKLRDGPVPIKPDEGLDRSRKDCHGKLKSPSMIHVVYAKRIQKE